ncbi:MAG: helix-turn-helix transcriptional regulator, partial [Clostridiaceae bacterium]|nr:helix-turn-helix transcriptional regulator [Clostridiaceae bacterium]
MILADKIINLRKKNGWSQEQLAERLNVTRQSVSKWEGAQSIPELDKILQLSQIFGVTTDYLIKEEIEDEEYVEINSPSDSDITNIKKVSLADAQEFLSLREQSIRPFSLAVSLMILAPIPLLLLTGASEYEVFNISEYLATAIGLIAIMILAAIGIGLIMKVS